MFAAFAPAVAQIGPIDEETAQAVTVQFTAQDAVSFYIADGIVTKIGVRARDVSYTAPLDCVAGGGLRDVHYDTALLSFNGTPGRASEGVSLLFDRGREDERRFGALPRVQISFSRGRLSMMLESRRTAPKTSFADNLCKPLPVPPRPLCAPDVPPPRNLPSAAIIVEALRPLTPALSSMFEEHPEMEALRRTLYEQLLARQGEAVSALADALRDPDANMRRNVTLAFGVLSGGWWSFECGRRKVDISSALPVLQAAFKDDDPSVRAWAMQAVGNMGSAGVPAVPALIEALEHGDVAARNSATFSLGQIGPGARAALPALRAALSDPEESVRRSASTAIERIEAR